jgi:hypothetical protein
VSSTKLTQGQAARAAGVSRTTIWRAMKDGRLSYEKADNGSFRIDLSELVRLFPDARIVPGERHARAGTETGTEGEFANAFNGLHALVRELKEDKTRLQAELERAAQERTQLLSMLDRQTDHIKLLTDQQQASPRAGFWQRLLRRA